MRLGMLARELAVVEGRYDADAPVREITADSRQVRPGDLFVAVRGRLTDGHRFLREAAARGAVAAVIDDPAVRPPMAYLRVPDSRVALAILAAVQYGRPAEQLRLIGVTGTVGKTSTAIMLAHILEAGGHRAGLSGSVHRRGDGTYVHSRYTTPGPLELHRRLRQLVDAGARVAVVEATSHALDQERLHGLRFAAGIFLNLLPEHLDYHGSFEAYARVKRRFLDHLAPGAPLAYNRGDSRVRSLVAGAEAWRPVGFAAGSAGAAGAEVTADQVVLTAEGSRFVLSFAGGRRVHSCRLSLLGRHQVVNATAAAAAAWALGVAPDRIAAGLASVPQFFRRLQVHRLGGVTVLDDTAGLPAAIVNCFESLEHLGTGPVVVLYAVRGSRGPELGAANARTLAACTQALAAAGVEVTLIVTESRDCAGAADQVTAAERAATMEALEQAGASFAYEPLLRAAVDRAAARAEAGTRVLLLGAQGMNAGALLLRQALGARRVRSGVPLS